MVLILGERSLEALKLAKSETEELHEKLRHLLINTQIVKQCIDIFLVSGHPSRIEAIEHAIKASGELEKLYTRTLGQMPEEVRRYCHGLKNRAKEVSSLAQATWQFDPTAQLTEELIDKLFVLRVKLDDYQRVIESSIRGLDSEVANKLFKYMTNAK